MTSFVSYAEESPFPVENLPYGIFRPSPDAPPRAGAAIGDYVLDLAVVSERGLLENADVRHERPFSRPDLNLFMSMGRGVWKATRSALQHLLDSRTKTIRDDEDLRAECLFHRSNVEMLLPATIGDYTDFYSSREHATNVGTMFRGKDNALQPNWLHLPVAYHGRASSVVVSGTDIRRPCGQTMPADAAAPVFGASRQVDFELETGFFVGAGNTLGEPIPIERALDHIFGFVLVNDWSARDIQKWEYVPLGPFLGKNFATTISPWIVTADALEPFRTQAPVQDPQPLPYLRSDARAAYDVHLEVSLLTPSLEQNFVLCRSNMKHLYWTAPQQLAHHTVNGCNARPGDLVASGTISGPTPESYGSLLELAWRGERPIRLPNGEERVFLQDGDTVIMTAWAQGNGYRVGFGEAAGRLLPARC